MPLDKIAIAALPKQQWKNRGGVSTDIAVEPPGAGWDDCLWRVGVAEIAASGPFSHFPGYDRQFVALGPGLSLVIDGQTRAAGSFEVVPFAGDATTECRLETGAGRQRLQAFNLILRRGAAEGSVACHPGAVRLAAPPGGVLVLFVPRGGFTVVEAGGPTVRLDAGEALVHCPATPLAAEPYKPWSLLVSAAIAPRSG